jgi:ribosomal protein S18 acetylase RimI-like enzyme
MSVGPVAELLERIEAYYDAVPRAAASVEEHGPLTLFVNRRPGWHYYARPRLGGSGAIRRVDVDAVLERQRTLGVPQAFEWVAETTPTLRATIQESGDLLVHELPLMVLGPAASADAAADGPRARIVPADTPDLAVLRAIVDVGFATPGTAVGPDGREALPAAAARLDRVGLSVLRERLRSGITVMAEAGDAEGPLAVGSHQPVAGVTEILGVATLPAARRRGLATAVTHALVADALARGCELVFLSADGDAVAALYERLGFRRIGTALVAEPAS